MSYKSGSIPLNVNNITKIKLLIQLTTDQS